MFHRRQLLARLAALPLIGALFIPKRAEAAFARTETPLFGKKEKRYGIKFEHEASPEKPTVVLAARRFSNHVVTWQAYVSYEDRSGETLYCSSNWAIFDDEIRQVLEGWAQNLMDSTQLTEGVFAADLHAAVGGLKKQRASKNQTYEMADFSDSPLRPF